MKKNITLVCISLLIAGCATASKTYTPDGKTGFNITCSGSVLSWGDCYQKAGDICGSKGYNLISQSGDQGSTVTSNQFGLYGGTVTSRSILVSCKE